MAARYRIQSVQTSRFLDTAGTIGTRVVSSGNPNNFFTFFPAAPKSGPPVPTVIQGQRGLFINPGPSKNHIVWLPEPYKWQVALIGGNYQFYPADGEDLYWFQSDETGPFVGLAPGKDLVEQQPVFRLIA